MWKTAIFTLLLSLAGCDRSQSPSTHVALGPEDFAAPEGAPSLAMLDAPPPPPKDGRTVYVCPMHPEVTSEQPGSCPKCNMTLEPKPAPAPEPHTGQAPTPHDHAAHDHAAHDHAAHDHAAHDHGASAR
ncbi:MAG: heavy metal-binding domain-containing protein [Polyangiaceae bacterium]